MTVDEIIKDYEKKRYDAVRKRDSYVKKINEKFPEIEEIEKKINDCGIECTSAIIKNPLKGDEIVAQMEEKIKKLKEERKQILKKFDLPEDYNKIKYSCEKCKDTGYIENLKCECFKEQLREYGYEKSNIGSLIKTQNFESFDFSFYSKEKNSQGISPLEYVKLAYNESIKFCDEFETTKNILFYGNSGLGKTYLSSCIAKRIIDKGYDVRYMSASKLFSIYDDYKFNRGVYEENKAFINEVYSCDLLIIDDLGTEFFTSNSLSFLYDLMNERIIKNKKIIISTNLGISELDKKYTPRFISRIYECFKPLKLEGENIRTKL